MEYGGRYCRNGHLRTEENTSRGVYVKNGLVVPRIRCKQCVRDGWHRRQRSHGKSPIPDPGNTSFLPTLPEIDVQWMNWLAGFIDGEGCFLIHAKEGCPSFALALRADDSAIIEEIQAKLEVGKVYGTKPAGRNSNPKTTYTICGVACWVLCQLLDRAPLRAKKSRDYAIWRRAVVIWTTTRFSPKRTSALLELKTAMEETRRFQGKGLHAAA